MKTAGEGGPYGMALLAAYLGKKDAMTLEDFLQNQVFADAESITTQPDPAEVEGFARYLQSYCEALKLEHTAVTCVK